MRNPLLPRERKEYHLAEKLRRLRSLRGLNQREVAQAAANLTPGNDEETGPRLRTQGNMIEWAFVCLTDKIEELKDKPTKERHDELTHWLATFDRADDEAMRNARTAGRLNDNNAKLIPKA